GCITASPPPSPGAQWEMLVPSANVPGVLIDGFVPPFAAVASAPLNRPPFSLPVSQLDVPWNAPVPLKNAAPFPASRHWSKIDRALLPGLVPLSPDDITDEANPRQCMTSCNSAVRRSYSEPVMGPGPVPHGG